MGPRFFRWGVATYHQPTQPTINSTRVDPHMSETRSRELLGHRTAGQTEVQPKATPTSLGTSHPSAFGPSFQVGTFLWPFLFPKCGDISFIWLKIIDNHVENLVFICFISTSVHDFLDIQFLKGHSHGIQETKLLAMPNGGAERCQLPCRSLRYF